MLKPIFRYLYKVSTTREDGQEHSYMGEIYSDLEVPEAHEMLKAYYPTRQITFTSYEKKLWLEPATES